MASKDRRNPLDRAAALISQHGMFPPNSRVAVAVSGGADSVCLLHVLRELAPRFNLTLSVAHIDHGIRRDASTSDADFVRTLAAFLNLPFHLHSAPVPALAAAHRDNLEQHARKVRHAFFADLLRTGAAGRIATGHTQSDQAETVLYRLARGSGLAGLAGILPVTREGLARPLLTTTRDEVETYLRAHAIAWREDETNRDLAYARNRIRHRILPLLRDELNPRVDEALAHLATLAGDEETYWDSQAQDFPVKDGAVLLDVASLAGVPVAVARRAARGAVQALKVSLRNIEFQHIEAILSLARSPHGHCRAQLPGVDVCRSFDWLRFAPTGQAEGAGRDFDLAVAPGVGYPIAGSDSVISLHVSERNSNQQACVKVKEELDWRKLLDLLELSGGSLGLRNWRPGDKYVRAGRTAGQKIKTLFQRARIPVWERRAWPVLTCGGGIVWSRQFGPAAGVAVGADCSTVLRVVEELSLGK